MLIEAVICCSLVYEAYWCFMHRTNEHHVLLLVVAVCYILEAAISTTSIYEYLNTKFSDWSNLNFRTTLMTCYSKCTFQVDQGLMPLLQVMLEGR